MYQVIRQYSGVTAQKELWQVMTRPIRTYKDAEHELGFHQKLRPDHEFFIIWKCP